METTNVKKQILSPIASQENQVLPPITSPEKRTQLVTTKLRTVSKWAGPE